MRRERDEAPAVGAARGFRAGTISTAIFAEHGEAAQSDAPALVALRARAARAGAALYALDGGAYVLSRWPGIALPNLHAASQLLAALGAF